MRQLLQWILPVIAITAVVLAGLDARGGDEPMKLAQTQTPVAEGIGGSDGPNPELCAGCFEQLKKDNHDCETLQGQDWQICREAAATAYRRCSKGC